MGSNTIYEYMVLPTLIVLLHFIVYRDAELYIVSETSTIQAFKVGERVSTDVATAQQKVHAIDIDLVARIIYWMDTSRSQSRLRRALMDVEDDSTIGIPQDLLVQNLVRAEGIAFDWVTRYRNIEKHV